MVEPSKEKLRRRPVCYELALEAQIITDRFDYEADGKILHIVAENVPVETCHNCKEQFSGPVAGRIRDEALCKALGLLTPTEIRALREQLGLSQQELAKLTGISETSIARWERGQEIQDRSLDRYLRLLAVSPTNRRYLESLGADKATNGTGQSERQEAAGVG